ncbi:MAG: CTP synthase [Candidatus Jidaibacter sp.]|jgi:CTP synthase|nr:CTP synthase [Candidatus Jidaibacter sp.]
MSRYIFITGGVVSSLGKGVASAALGALLQSAGYKVRLRKLDPYLNVDPGTMNPNQHGEVFVTEDGAETDLDLGHYERFTGVDARRGDNITTGKIYSDLITKERRGEYLGVTVQVIPHVTDLIKNFILSNTDDVDFTLCEIGGTVGDIEAQPFCEAIRQLGYQLGKEKSLYLHLTLVPYIPTSKELKTKPTQHSVKELRSIGIQPDILLCRSQKPISESDRTKIALFCNMTKETVIQGLDQKTIYHALLDYHKEGLAKQVLKSFGLPHDDSNFNIQKWQEIVENLENPKDEVRIAVVGKYTKLKDSYKSLIEALHHAGIQHQHKVKIVWINAGNLHEDNIKEKLSAIDGILVPGGFGVRDTEGKILAIKYARTNKIPFFGICLGMQLAMVEFARNVLSIKDASSTEFGYDCTPIIAIMDEWDKDGKVVKRSHDLGGTMRLGAYPCNLQKKSKAYAAYGAASISERHRHRYEFNVKFKEQFENHGMMISGMSPDETLTEIAELKDHPWFIGVQFHPELKSRAFAPHPLFNAFIEHAIAS